MAKVRWTTDSYLRPHDILENVPQKHEPRGAGVKPGRKAIGPLAGLLLIALALVAGAACSQSPEAKKQQALALIETIPAGDAPADLRRTTAAALLGLGKLAEAEQAYRAILAKDPKDVLSLTGLGAIALSRNQPAEA